MNADTPASGLAAKGRTRGTKPQPLEAATLPQALLKVRTVAAITGLSPASIYRKLATGFPQPIRMGARCTRWRAGDVTAWLAAQSA